MIREKILFAGGCHVAGHPVGSEYAFPRLAAQELEREGIPCEISCVPHVPLHRPEMVVSACREFRPDTLVLQPGNYEVTKNLRSYLMSPLRGRKEKRKSSASAGVHPVGRFRFLVEARVKQIVDCVLWHPLVDFQLLGSKMEQFLAAVAHCGPEKVLVMSSTPCADPTQYYSGIGRGRLSKPRPSDMAASFWTFCGSRRKRYGAVWDAISFLRIRSTSASPDSAFLAAW